MALLSSTVMAASTCETPHGSAPPVPVRGAQAAAIRAWTETIETTASADPKSIEALIRRGETYRALGRYPDAAADLLAARSAAAGRHQEVMRAVATQALGQVRMHQQRSDEAEALLTEAQAAAERLRRPTVAAAAANGLGTILLDRGRADEAKAQYRQALASARQAGDQGLVAAVRRNRARLAMRPDRALAELEAARAAADRVAEPQERTDLLLGIAADARQLVASESARSLELDVLLSVRDTALQRGLLRAGSRALGQLATLYAEQGRSADALQLTEQAIYIAPKHAYDLLYRWEWQLGRWFREVGEQDRAVAAYRRAVAHIEQIRQDIPVEYPDGRSSFRATLEPLYLGLADLLLEQARMRRDTDQVLALLREARDTVEQIKIDELRDYFRDACIVPLREDIETLSPRAAVLYPIILPDRLEILVSIGSDLYQRTVPVVRDELEITAEILGLKLRYDRPSAPEAEMVYDWLIEPIAGLLAQRDVDTIVFVPDGPLRTIPLAALEKDGTYLAEHYAVATAPGLKLLDPERLRRTDLDTLLAGLSRPGPVVNKLPAWWVDDLVEQYRRVRQSGDRGGRRGSSIQASDIAAGGDAQRTARPASDAEKIEALRLPGVTKEIDALSRQLPALTLRDEQFLLQRFVTEIDEHPYRIVHIASHGLFIGPPEDNFIVTYDKKLDMKTLAASLKPKELAQRPVEILVLSACQTAEGDDRTPLGLSGVALQSGARSALGSLWPVSDAATQLLMQHFYENLKDPAITKGQALQRAQRILIESREFNRPNFWAPFILVGNWL